jgi:hypothetical protein
MNQPGELDIPLNGVTRTLHIIRYRHFLESSNAEQTGILLLESPITTPNIIPVRRVISIRVLSH